MTNRVIGLVAHAGKTGACDLVRKLRDEFAANGLPLCIEASTAALIGEESALTSREVAAQSDLLLVLGGDGTILQLHHDIQDQLQPVFGINLGSLGFLTCASSKDWKDAVRTVLDETYTLTNRSRLSVEVERGGEVIARRSGLNDAVISRGSLSRLIRLETRVNGEDLTNYNADGLIISTPTGSTAYSLAAGGPLLMPDSGVFVVTPICPHVLTNRSVIVPDDSIIEVTPCRGQDSVFLTVDGQELLSLAGEDRVTIRRAERPLPLAMLPGTSFLHVLREKLKWSGAAI
jgi:NAD+ kinase